MGAIARRVCRWGGGGLGVQTRPLDPKNNDFVVVVVVVVVVIVVWWLVSVVGDV